MRPVRVRRGARPAPRYPAQDPNKLVVSRPQRVISARCCRSLNMASRTSLVIFEVIPNPLRSLALPLSETYFVLFGTQTGTHMRNKHVREAPHELLSRIRQVFLGL